MDEGRTILAPVDFSTHSRAAAIRACDLAAAMGGSVRLVHALDLPALARRKGFAEHLWDDLRRSEQGQLDALLRDLEHRGVPISARLEECEPVALIDAEVGAADVELVVVGARGDPGLDRVFEGGIVAQVVRRAHTPVMVVKENEWDAASRIRRILVATDFSADADDAVALTIAWAKRLGADVEVFHAITQAPAGRAEAVDRDTSADSVSSARSDAIEGLQSILSRMAQAGVPANAELGYGAASTEIVRRARQGHADVLIMGRHGHSRVLEQLCGSVTASVLRDAPCSVLLSIGRTAQAG
jgi:nucleotide-binding universal stress UspA family protein